MNQDDEVPLGQLYQVRENLYHLQPPPYSTEDPPMYTPKEEPLQETTIHRVSCLLVAFDLVYYIDKGMNLLLLLVSAMLSLTYLKWSPTILIPITFLLISVIGKTSFIYQNTKWMIVYCGCYFARWCGDLSCLMYTYFTDQTDYFKMTPFTFFYSYFMLGIRGFYSDLFPCYFNDAGCTLSDQHNMFYWMIGILLPQLYFIFILFYDTISVIRNKEADSV